MPQMAPYNWLIMFLYFNMIFIITISHNYFIIFNINNNNNNKINKKNLFYIMW